MLVLSRRENEKIVVPELGITLEIVRIKGNTVRIGIEAPREIRVMRGEIIEREVEQMKIAANRTIQKTCVAYGEKALPADAGVDPKNAAIRETAAKYKVLLKPEPVESTKKPQEPKVVAC